MTAADMLREEGELRGVLKGELKGVRKILLKQLGLRFGALPEVAVSRINAADLAQLHLWVDRLLTAPTLADVLGDA